MPKPGNGLRARVRVGIRGSTLAVLAVAAVIFGAGQASAAAFNVTEVQVPTPGAGPFTLAIGSDHATWFTEFTHDAVGRLQAGHFSQFRLTESGLPDSIAAGPDGALWFTDDTNDVIWRITTSGSLSSFPIPPCTGCQFSGGSGVGNIIAGPEGALWYSRPGNDAIGRITTSGDVQEFPVARTGSYPGWITAGPDGAIWFTVSEGIARMTTEGSVSIVYDGLNYPSSIVTGPDGNLWFTGFYEDVVGRLTPGTGDTVKLFPLPLGCAPQNIAAARGALWMSCYEQPVVYRASIQGRATAINVPSGESVYGLAGTANGPVFFGDYVANRIGEITFG